MIIRFFHNCHVEQAPASLATPTSSNRGLESYLQHLQLLQSLLHELLYPPLLALRLVFPERVARSPPGVLAEIVCGELAALPEEGAILQIQSFVS
jgi:hypothetical protein